MPEGGRFKFSILWFSGSYDRQTAPLMWSILYSFIFSLFLSIYLIQSKIFKREDFKIKEAFVFTCFSCSLYNMKGKFSHVTPECQVIWFTDRDHWRVYSWQALPSRVKHFIPRMKYAIVSAVSLELSNWGVIFLPFYLLLSTFSIKMDGTLTNECSTKWATTVGRGQ